MYLFTLAFSLLALCMLVWLTVVVINDARVTKELILASDALLLMGSACMILIFVKHYESYIAPLLALLGSVLLGIRAVSRPPTAYVHDGLLYFNLNTSMKALIVGGFLLFWLPGVMNVASYISQDISLRGGQNLVPMLFTFTILSTALFVSARRSWVIIVLFVVITILFGVMAAINVTISKIHRELSVGIPKQGVSDGG